MEYVKLGRSGLEVSRICLGCMTPTRWWGSADQRGEGPAFAEAGAFDIRTLEALR